MKSPTKQIPAWVGELTRAAFPRLVAVEWVDSHISSGWTCEKVDAQPQTCVSVGWVLAESKEALSVSPHISIEDEPQRNGTMTIPKCSIKRMADLL